MTVIMCDKVGHVLKNVKIPNRLFKFSDFQCLKDFFVIVADKKNTWSHFASKNKNVFLIGIW